MKAYCWASGLIEFGDTLPGGALPIATGPEEPLRDFVSGNARHGYKTRLIKGRPTKIPGTDTLLVPGVPEATDEFSQVNALTDWLDAIKPNAPKGVSV